MAEQELPKEELLRKMLNMTTSDNDGQALVAIRKANALLAQAGWSWDKLLAGKIKIIESPFKNMPNPAPKQASVQDEWRSRNPSPPPQRPADPYNVRGATTGRGLGLNRKNMYANYCYCCGDYVANDVGFIMKPKDHNPSAPDKWSIVCASCNQTCNYVPVKASMKNTGQTTVRAPAPNLGDL